MTKHEWHSLNDCPDNWCTQVPFDTKRWDSPDLHDNPFHGKTGKHRSHFNEDLGYLEAWHAKQVVFNGIDSFVRPARTNHPATPNANSKWEKI